MKRLQCLLAISTATGLLAGCVYEPPPPPPRVIYRPAPVVVRQPAPVYVQPPPPPPPVYVQRPPPPPVYVERPPPPPPEHPYWVWQRGIWRWDGYRWVWLRGHYVERLGY